MKNRIGGTPPSRQGKSQIQAFLPPDLVDKAHMFANQRRMTIQEVVGLAVNSALMAHGKDPLIKIHHDRIVRRSRGRSQITSGDATPACRSGKRRLCGWFPREDVDKFNWFVAESGKPVHELVKIGLERILTRSSD